MDSIGLYLFGYFMAYYGLMIVLGILISFIYAYIQIRRYKLSFDDFFIICSLSAVFGISGTKILYLIVSYKNINFLNLSNLTYLNSIMSAGFVFLGGVLGFFVALFICEKILKLSTKKYIQACIACLPIIHGFGRIGCSLVGCCHGKPFNSFFSIIYTNSIFAPNGIPLLPVQLIEAFLEFIIAIFLIVYNKKLKGYSGLFVYILCYSTIRFVLEFLRNDVHRGKIFNLSTSQFISLPLFFISLIFLIIHFKKEKYNLV